jgi:hypothetical protein
MTTENRPSNLVARLRDWSREDDADIGHEAADRIELLEDELLKAAIQLARDASLLLDHVRRHHEAKRGETPVHRKWPGEPPHCPSCDCGMFARCEVCQRMDPEHHLECPRGAVKTGENL